MSSSIESEEDLGLKPLTTLPWIMSNTETGAQLLARLGSRPDVSRSFPSLFPDGIKTKDVIEFYGEEGTGKSEMMFNVISSLILPKTWNELTLDGADASVLFIDTDYKFSILRLVTILEKKILEAQANCVSQNQTKAEKEQLQTSSLTNESLRPVNSNESDINSVDVEKFIKDCLTKLNVVRCTSSSQLLLTLSNFENLIASNPNICVLMVDSISAFYWTDRGNGGESVAAQEININRIVHVLSHLIDSYNLILFASKPAFFKKRTKEGVKGNNSAYSSSEHFGDYFEYLSKSWTKLVKHRFVFKKCFESLSGDMNFSVTSAAGETKCFIITECGVIFVK